MAGCRVGNAVWDVAVVLIDAVGCGIGVWPIYPWPSVVAGSLIYIVDSAPGDIVNEPLSISARSKAVSFILASEAGSMILPFPFNSKSYCACALAICMILDGLARISRADARDTAMMSMRIIEEASTITRRGIAILWSFSGIWG